MIQPNAKSERTYKVLTKEGFDRENPAFKLYQKAKKLGVWDPRDIDVTKDKEDWKKLTDIEQQYLLGSIMRFDVGEECVSEDLLPLIATQVREGRLEDEMYLSTFLFEEIKHTDFFRSYVDDVIQPDQDLSQLLSPVYKKIFFDMLPTTMNRLWTDSSPKAQLDASILYNMIVEGVLAESGYYAFYCVLDKYDILPGLREGVKLIQRDESRHIGYGVYLIARIVSEHPELLDYVHERMDELMVVVKELQEEGAKRYDHMEVRPFGMERGFTNQYAMERYQGRMNVINRVHEKTMQQIRETDYELIGSLAGSQV